MASTIGYAILAVLARNPRTGYDPAARGHAGQLLLDRARQTDPPGPGAAARRRPGGVRGGPRPGTELVLETYAAFVADRGELLAVFHQQVAAHRERLARYEADLRSLERRFGGPPPVTEREFGSYATLRCGMSYERHRIGWCEWMTEQLQSPE